MGEFLDFVKGLWDLLWLPALVIIGGYLVFKLIVLFIGALFADDGIIGDIVNIFWWLVRNWWKILIILFIVFNLLSSCQLPNIFG